MKNRRAILVLTLSFAVTKATFGCSPSPINLEPDHSEIGGNDGHGHDETNDLDRTIQDLFSSRCEHDTRTYRCDECRYEVGVVKAPSELIDGGLLDTLKPSRETIKAPLNLTGEVKFDERRVTHVSTLAEGIVKEVQVTLGDRVERGAPLLSVESVVVGEAQAAFLEARGQLKLAESVHDRVTDLHAEGIAPRQELQEASQRLDAARIRVEATLGKLTRLGMTRTDARSLTHSRASGRLVLRAPASGTVLSMHAVAGEVARSETSLLTVGDNSSLWVWADLYERDIAIVSREQAKGPLSAMVEVNAFPEESFGGVVDFVSPAMSESSRTVKLRIAVPNPTGRLLAGMFAKVKVFVATDREAITLPREAVLEDEGRAFVFVRHGADYYLRRPVSVGQRFAGRVEIVSGLDGDEVVVSEGAFLMKSDVLRSKMGAGCAD